MANNIFSCEHVDEDKITCLIDGKICSVSCDCYNSCDNCIHNDGTEFSCNLSSRCALVKSNTDLNPLDYDIVSILNTIRESKK